ncbi:MAG: hypothetical protein P1U77_29410 [Rubripirellula sp.]|nr:hypothetical protein [Rubripirellula sp.]
MPEMTLHSPAKQQARYSRINQLSLRQLERIIFLDFESFQDGPPLLCGTLVSGHFQQTVLDETLQPAAVAKNIQTNDLKTQLIELVECAERENRLICGYSNKELHDLEGITGRQLGDLYVNALPLAKKWRKRFYPQAHDRVMKSRKRLRQRGAYLNGRGNRLLDFAGMLNVSPPRDYGKGCEASRLRHVRGQLERRREYKLLTPVAKAKWTKALKHNAFDVQALAMLCRRIATDFGW